MTPPAAPGSFIDVTSESLLMHRPQLPRALSLVAALAALAACRPSPTGPRAGLVGAVPPVVRAAGPSTAVAGHPVAITPALWRDFQPVSPADGKPLIVVVRVAATDGATLPPAVTADSVWVILGDQAWSAAVVEEQPRAATGAELTVVARGGPKWAPGSRVDVVLRLRTNGGTPVYVGAPNQAIARTD